MTKLIILGASGHGKVVAEIAEECGFTVIEFVDDRYPELQTIGPWPSSIPFMNTWVVMIP